MGETKLAVRETETLLLDCLDSVLGNKRLQAENWPWEILTLETSE